MGTGTCLFFDWENGIWVTETRIDRHNNGNAKVGHFNDRFLYQKFIVFITLP